MLAHAAISPAIHAASIGIPDTLLLMLLALMVFGPRRLPEIGRQIGKLMYEFRKISNDFKFQMEEELRLSEEADRQRQLAAAQPVHTPPLAPDFATAALPAASDSTAPVEAAAELPAIEATAAREHPAPTDSASSVASPVTSAIPTIHPPTQGGVVPRAFRGLVPPSVAAPESMIESTAPQAGIPSETPSPTTPQPASSPSAPVSPEAHG